VCAGSGTIHSHNPAWKEFEGKTEADLFTSIAIKMGVPEKMIFTENSSQNTGQNYEFTDILLRERGISFETVIAVQKPYMERRTYATGKVWWPDKEILVTSPQLSLDDYRGGFETENDYWLHAMVGDLQRIKEYPAKGFQIEQEIPENVWGAYEFLVGEGYTKTLIS
jgi:uncharacterized SAM-binding protein YcdF (DUF218 family)